MNVPTVTYSKSEEMANTISHAVGLLAAVVAIVFLVSEGTRQLNITGNIGVWIYAFGLIMAFASSSLYHGIREPRLKILFKKLDHISIYFLISGSYTILILNRLMSVKGFLFLAALWGMTLVGIWFKARYVHRFKVFSTVIYILMGYIVLLDPYFFLSSLKRNTVMLMAISGAFYTVGAGFYLWKSKQWTHFTWHLFVIVAAGLHFAAMYLELFT